MTAPSPGGLYIALRNTEPLRADVETFIDAIRDRVPEDQNARLVRIMEGFLDEAIDALVGDGSEAMQLQGMSKKVVDTTVSMLKGTCHLLSRRVLRNLKNDEVRALAEHMDDLRLVVRAPDGTHRSMTVIPLPVDLHAEMLRLSVLITDESPALHRGALQDMLFWLLDVLVEHLYVRTLGTLRLGPIARRVVEMGYSTAHGGSRTMIGRVLPHLADDQVRRAADFVLGLVIRVDEAGIAPAPRASTITGLAPTGAST